MSRYVQVDLPLRDLAEVCTGLTALGLPHQRSTRKLMLAGSLECAGEPVDVRLPAGTLDAVEDFGFVARDDGRIELVCGELDRDALQRGLIAPLLGSIASARVHADAGHEGLELLSETLEHDGTRRLVLRRR